jgi:hypothetical protein
VSWNAAAIPQRGSDTALVAGLAQFWLVQSGVTAIAVQDDKRIPSLSVEAALSLTSIFPTP